MSRIATAAANNCPLSDCTLAVNNAENIRNTRDKALLGLKVGVAASQPRSTARVAKNEKAPSARRERVVGAARKLTAQSILTTTTTTTTATPADTTTTLEAHRPSVLDLHVFAKPFTPSSSPHHNNPYALCLLRSPCSPEDSFYACYGETEAEAETTVPTSLVNTPVRVRVGAQKASIGETTRNLLEMFSLMSTPNKSPNSNAAPLPTAESQSASTSPERATSPSQLQPQQSATSTRVVRKVVSCNVDRTSGRPVPKPRAAQ